MAALTGRGIETQVRNSFGSVRTTEHHVALLAFRIVALVALDGTVRALQVPTRARVIESVTPPTPPVHQIKVATGVFRVALRAFATALAGVQPPVLFQHPGHGLVTFEALDVGTVIATNMAAAAISHTVQPRMGVTERTR
jgi:hypothetical protein